MDLGKIPYVGPNAKKTPMPKRVAHTRKAKNYHFLSKWWWHHLSLRVVRAAFHFSFPVYPGMGSDLGPDLLRESIAQVSDWGRIIKFLYIADKIARSIYDFRSCHHLLRLCRFSGSARSHGNRKTFAKFGRNRKPYKKSPLTNDL